MNHPALSCAKWRKLFLLTLLWPLSLPVQARDLHGEFWGSTEFQLNITEETSPLLAWHDVIPDRLRVYSEAQFASDLGLQQSLLRVGPVWVLWPWLNVATHLASVSAAGTDKQFIQELRCEFEPSLSGELLPDLRWNNRHRLEYRIRPDKQSWRYSTRLGLNYRIAKSNWTAFVSDELHFELSGSGLNQNRLLLGLSYQLTPSTQLSLSWINRLLPLETSWNAENGVFLSLYYSSQETGVFQMPAD